MTNKEILDQLRKTPFVPFLLLTADGREYRVRHPELIAIGPTSRTCAVVAEDNHIATLDVRLPRRAAYGAIEHPGLVRLRRPTELGAWIDRLPAGG
jgi:hypothetical protein